MGITDDVKVLEEELAKLFGYMDLNEQSRLNRIANVYLPLGLLTGVLGIGTFVEKGFFKNLFESKSLDVWLGGDLISLLVILLCLFFPLRYYLTTKK